MGDHWRHRCLVEQEKADPLEEYGPLPAQPVAIWGWGSIPDQHGRRTFDGDDEEDEDADLEDEDADEEDEDADEEDEDAYLEDEDADLEDEDAH
jgi:hypothetical protein